MKTFLAVTALAGLFAAVSAPANAFPWASGHVTIGTNNAVTDVGWRCGPHRHWSFWRHSCVLNRWFR